MTRNALVVGGGSGIGMALAAKLAEKDYETIYVVGLNAPIPEELPINVRQTLLDKMKFIRVNFVNEDFSFLDDLQPVQTLIITAGFGRVAKFEALTEAELVNGLRVNALAAMRILQHFYGQLHSQSDFYAMVMGSIAGHVTSPFFSVYGASKAALCSFVETLNVELTAGGYPNRILDVSPGKIVGTRFDGGKNCIDVLYPVADSILDALFARKILYIPQYEETYQSVIERYHADPMAFGLESYAYKLQSGRTSTRPQTKIGYLSGTFDMFHIGHLNLLRRAKEYCDYLIVGVHGSGAWKGKETYIPLEERMEILKSIRYVDKVIPSLPEDCDVYEIEHYDYLFVGSDYQGTERFNRYEKFFEDKGVKIVYFPYTQGTSSTQLRAALSRE